jgi:serine/threonine protein kinase
VSEGPLDGDRDAPDVGLAETEAAPTPRTPSAARSSGSGRGAPETVGRFRVDGTLGSGGMGDVFRAYDPVLDRAVALKVLHPGDGNEGPQRSRRVLREARAAASLSHANAVTVFEVGEADGEVFIAMELLEGEDLRGVMDRGTATVPEKLRWLLDAARALAAAHERGLVHRDVKPENMFVCKGGALKLLDFGIAKRGDDEPAAAPPSDDEPGPSSLRTEEGRRIGTPRYMAPEQHFGHATDARTDQYAWGLVAFELLTGTHPNESQVTVTKRDALGAPRVTDACLAALDGHVAEPIARMIARTLGPQKEERFSSMNDVVAVLESARADAPSSREPAANADPAPPRDPSRDATTAPASDREPPPAAAGGLARRAPSRRRAAIGIVGALVVAAAVSAFVWSRRTPRDAPPAVTATPTGACQVASGWSLGVGEAGRFTAMPDGALVVARDIRRGLAFERVTADGTSAPFLPDNPMATLTDFTDVSLFGRELGGEAVLVLFVNQLGRTDLLAALPTNGGFSSTRLPTIVNGIDIVTGEAALLMATTGEAFHTSDGRSHLGPGARVHRLSREGALHTLLEDGVTGGPSVAAAGGRTAIAYSNGGQIRAAFVDDELNRTGDAMLVARSNGHPAATLPGKGLAVFWAEDHGGRTRLTSAHLAPGATAFSAPRVVADEPLSARAPIASRLPDGRWSVTWIAARGGESVLRVAPVGSDGALGAPSEIAVASAFPQLAVTPTRRGLAFTWRGADARAHVAEVICGGS